jgi:hypothetical protein
VNLRTAKINLLMLLNDRTPIEHFDVTGPFDFTKQLSTLDEFRNLALDTLFISIVLLPSLYVFWARPGDQLPPPELGFIEEGEHVD